MKLFRSIDVSEVRPLISGRLTLEHLIETKPLIATHHSSRVQSHP